jgi:calcineurin-like phosphoesterase family protein
MHQSNRLNAFGSIEEMDAQFIDTINSLVLPGDELWHLGDFCWQASRAGHYRQRLNVRKLFTCQGNHDSNSLRKHVSSMCDMVCRKFPVKGKPCRFHMCHYPLLSWSGLHHGSIHLYGHSHGIYEDMLDKTFPGRRAMDVGVDAISRLTGEYRPFSLDEVITRLVKDEEVSLPKLERLPGPFEGLE